jgi:hypothetical protein
MDLELVKRAVNSFRRKLALVVFALFIAWPIFHIVLVKNSRISSWRFFGWGMYATPNPDAQSRLRVVIIDKSLNQNVDVAKLHASLTKLSFDTAQESTCLNLFLEDSDHRLERLPRQGLCQKSDLAKKFDYFLHFGSPNHLAGFVREALFRANRSGFEAVAFMTHQRFSLFQRKAYVESDIYRVWGDKVEYLGKIKSEG